MPDIIRKYKEIPMCRFYTTTGYPTFNPKCIKKKTASKKCHERREDCPEYQASLSKVVHPIPAYFEKYRSIDD